MRIAINGRFLAQNMTGVQRVCREFTQALDDMLAAGEFPKVSARIIVPASDVFEAPLYKSIKIERVGKLRGYAWEQFNLPREAGGDLLLCLANLAPVIRLAFTKSPTIVMVHDLSYKYFPSAYSRSFRAAYSLVMPIVMRRADSVITVSEAERHSILKEFSHVEGLPDRLIALANGGFSIETLARTLDATPPVRERFALYVGSLSRRKNMQGLLDASIRLAREDGLRLVVAGGATGIFQDAGLSIPSDVADKFEFLGQIDNLEVLLDLYRRAAVLVFPSHYESSGLPPLEAMSLGCPVVVSSIPALVERCGDAAEYCDPSDTSSIVSAVKRVINNPGNAALLSRAGIQRAKLFSWEHQVRGVLERARHISA